MEKQIMTQSVMLASKENNRYMLLNMSLGTG